MPRARGKVIDPKGMQDCEMTWGYIEREDYPWSEKNTNNKVIPFLNYNPETFKIGIDVTFDVKKVCVNDPYSGYGTLGIAINVTPIEQDKY